jgi:hypothetical protein
MHDHLLEPLGARATACSIASAVEQYLQLRQTAERSSPLRVNPRLGEEVLSRLQEEGLA